MDARLLSRDLEARANLKRTFQLVLVASLVTNALLAAAWAMADRSVRYVFVPPEISQSFWVEGDRIGPEYLEQMGLFVLQLTKTVTPQSVDYQTSQLLRYAHPQAAADLERRTKAGALRLKGDNVSTTFGVRGVYRDPNPANFRVAFGGTYDTWFGATRVGSVPKTFMVVFAPSGSRFFVKDLVETSEKDPFTPLAAPQ
jgi:conjugal transfer pilus assembly protein TraE